MEEKMVKPRTNHTLSFLCATFILTLFLPWILQTNLETYSIDPVSGWTFLLNNPLILGWVLLALITYLLHLKNRSIKILLILAVELVFLVALLMAPAFYMGMEFLIGVRYGYYSGLVMLIVSIFITLSTSLEKIRK